MTPEKKIYYLKKICPRFAEVENHGLAAADNYNKWILHHRLGVKVPRKQLIALDLYFNRPPNELVFVTESEHLAIHGYINGNWYNDGSVEVRTSSCPEGFTAGRLAKMNWYNDGTRNVRAKSCPEGFVQGRVISEELREKVRANIRKAVDSHTGKFHFTDGKTDVIAAECPKGFWRGRPSKAAKGQSK